MLKPYINAQTIGRWRWLCYVLGLWTVASLMFRAATHTLGVDPYDTLIRTTGDRALLYLILSLAMTPLRQLFKSKNPLWFALRMPLGLLAYTYACLHFAIFLIFDLQFSGVEWLRLLQEKPYFIAGFTAWLLLTPLAITSIKKLRQAMGQKRWQWLHRSVYGIVILGLLHFVWMSKIIPISLWLYMAMTVFLLGYRVMASQSSHSSY